MVNLAITDKSRQSESDSFNKLISNLKTKFNFETLKILKFLGQI